MSIADLVLPKLRPTFSGVSSLGALQKLLSRSSEASSHFAAHGATIFESVLASRQIHEHTCALIRITALIRANALPPQVSSLSVFKDFVRHETTSWRYWPPTWTDPPVQLSPATVPASTLRGILDTQEELESRMVRCLKFYLQRFNALRPNHLEDPEFRWEKGCSAPDGHYAGGAWNKQPAQKPFPVHDIGPPTWVEEQRVLRALWRVQLLRDLKAAASRPSFRWDRADMDELEKAPVECFHQSYRPWTQPSSATFHNLTVPEWSKLLEERLQIVQFDETSGMVGLDFGCDTREEYTAWGIETALDGEDPELLIDVTRAPPREMHASCEDQLVWSVLEYPEEKENSSIALREWPTPAEETDDWKALSDWNSNAIVTYSTLTDLHDTSLWKSPLQHVSFKPFRNLDFAIWSAQRMASYGLEGFGFNVDANAWRSVLGEAELAEVKRRNQGWVEGT